MGPLTALSEAISRLWHPLKRELEIDERGVRRRRGDAVESVDWADLVEVVIATTSDGPFAEDLFWMLVGRDKKGCAVPGSQAQELLGRLQRLPRFDNMAVVKASGSTEDAFFPAWKGEPGEGLVCGPLLTPRRPAV